MLGSPPHLKPGYNNTKFHHRLQHHTKSLRRCWEGWAHGRLAHEKPWMMCMMQQRASLVMGWTSAHRDLKLILYATRCLTRVLTTCAPAHRPSYAPAPEPRFGPKYPSDHHHQTQAHHHQPRPDMSHDNNHSNGDISLCRGDRIEYAAWYILVFSSSALAVCELGRKDLQKSRHQSNHEHHCLRCDFRSHLGHDATSHQPAADD